MVLLFLILNEQNKYISGTNPYPGFVEMKRNKFEGDTSQITSA